MKCCANVYFNHQCCIKKVIPKCANIKIPYTSLATNFAQKKIQTNNDLYRIYLLTQKLMGIASSDIVSVEGNSA